MFYLRSSILYPQFSIPPLSTQHSLLSIELLIAILTQSSVLATQYSIGFPKLQRHSITFTNGEIFLSILVLQAQAGR